MSMSLDSDLRERLNKRRGDWPRIAATARISHSWLSQFVRGKIPNPGFTTLRKLAACLDAEGAPPLPAEAEPAKAAA